MLRLLCYTCLILLFMNTTHFDFSRIVAARLLSVLLALAFTPAVQAQEALVGDAYQQINRLIVAKNHTAALQAAEKHLKDNPSDPQMRLLKSRILVAQKQPKAALDILLGITQEFPEIAEPYNNLAVLYAEVGELDQAKIALENALRIQPNYQLALHNLGDVYRRIAQNYYQKALALQPNNTTLKKKIRTLKK